MLLQPVFQTHADAHLLARSRIVMVLHTVRAHACQADAQCQERAVD